MKKQFNKLIAFLLSFMILMSVSAEAAEGVGEYVQSEEFAQAVDVASNTVNEFGDEISSIFKTEKHQKKKKKEKFKKAKAKNKWNMEDVISMYQDGYALEDIGTAMELAPKMDKKPFDLLEKKGKPTYKAHKKEMKAQEASVLATSDLQAEGIEPEYDFEKQEKSWETALAEVNGHEIAANEDLQTIKENGLLEYIDPSVFTAEELAYLTTEETEEQQLLSLTAASTTTDDLITDTYNNYVFPSSRYSQYQAGAPYATNEEIEINPFSLNATVRTTDLSLKGKNGLDLNLTRVHSNINSGNWTPIVRKTNAQITSETHTYYSVTGFARVKVIYNEPLADGSYSKTFDSEMIVFKQYRLEDTSSYDFAGRNALLHDRERLANHQEPIYMFESYDAANHIKTKALDGFYDKDFYFGTPDTKISCVEFTVIVDPDIITVNSEGTHTIYLEEENVDYYCTNWYDDSLTNKYFDIGLGWEFDFPYIERLYSNTSSTPGGANYLHFGSKGIWRITDDDELENYYADDLTLTYGESFSDTESWYTVTEKDGKKYHFGNLGQLLAIVDRFGNTISFEYETYQSWDGHEYPYHLTKITDTVGREINFDYTNPLQTVVTVADENDSTQNRTIKYNKTLMNAEENDFVLSSVVDAENNETVYTYDENTLSVSLTTKTFIEGNYLDITHYPLKTILKPTKERIFFWSNVTPGNCGTDGIAKYLTTIRYARQNPDNTAASSFSQYYAEHFGRSTIRYDGYPEFRSKEEIPTELDISTTNNISLWNGMELTNTKEYSRSDNDNWLCRTSTLFWEGTTTDNYCWRERTEYEYNTREQCIKQTHKKFHDPKDETSYQSTVTEYSYDARNNPLTIKRFGSEEYTVSYEYDSTYSLPTKKTFKQDADTTVIENYTLTEDKKSVAQSTVTANNATKRKAEYSYDSFGNVIAENRYTGENGWTDFVQIDYCYDDLSGNEITIDGANISKISVSGIRDADGNLIPATDGGTAGTVEYSYTYDWFGNILTETDCNGNVFSYSYDKLNHPTRMVNPEQGTIGISYGIGALNNYVQITNELGNVTKYSYLSSGELIEEKDVTADKVLKSYEYTYTEDELYYTKLITATHSDYGNTKYENTLIDPLGRAVSTEITDSAGAVLYQEEYVYEQAVDNLYDCVTKTVKGETADKDYTQKQYTDKFGNLVKEEIITQTETGEEVLTTEYTYDYVGNLLSVKSPRAITESWTDDIYTAQYEYDIDGQVTKTTDIYGSYTLNEYDGLGRLVRTADAESTASAAPYYTTYVYDALGRVLKSHSPIADGVSAETKYTYDNNGNVIRMMVKNGSGTNDYAVTETTYNWRNSPTRVLTDGTDSAYYYDVAGNILRMYTGELSDFVISGPDSVSGADYEMTAYTYDSQNRVISTTDALGKTTYNTYDLNGNLTKSIDRNQAIQNFVYDALGNLTEQSAQASADADKESIYTYSYNRMGLPITMTASDITTTYTYDNFGRLQKESLTNGIEKQYNYDSHGNRIQFRLLQNDTEQMNTTYTYDKLDRVQTVTNGTNVSAYSYDKNGRLLSENTDGYTTAYQYNRAGWITNLATQQNGTAIQSHSYSYQPDGNISAKQSTLGTQTLQYSYLYDDAGRLVQEQIGSDVKTYAYDAFGNRTAMASAGASYTYQYDDNNRLLQEIRSENGAESRKSYAYDDNGNQIAWYESNISAQGGTPSLALADSGEDFALYGYDLYNRLTSYTCGDTTASYTYDGNNLRQTKTVNGVTTSHIWDGANMVMETAGTDTKKYYRTATGISYANINGTIQYFHKDGHGDVTALTDSIGTITKTYTYDAFGTELNTDPTDSNPFRYCGEYFDQETGQIYLRNRYYNSSVGRFITEDPIKDGLNWYAYCGNNPIMFVDPTGEAIITSTVAFIIGCTIVSAVGTAVTQIAINIATEQSWNNDLLTATASGAASGLVFGATLNPQYSVLAGTFVTTGMHIGEGVYNGDPTSEIALGAVEDMAWGVAAYGTDKLIGVFIKTNPGWFQPKGLKSFFTKSYGQKIVKQTLANGAITATIVSMYENNKRNTEAIQEFLGITVDGSYGPETQAAVYEFQEEMIKVGYLEAGGADGFWGPNTDDAFRKYITDNVLFVSQN